MPIDSFYSTKFLNFDKEVDSVAVVAHQTQQTDSKDVLKHLSTMVDVTIHIVPTQREVVLEGFMKTVDKDRVHTHVAKGGTIPPVIHINHPVEDG
eukprot:m.218718 g.218718  ORF g.218718 m.218718 type:complete len:95 (-) comp17222_c0_seq1:3010-3294(-)